MENKTVEVYITLDKEGLEATKKEAAKAAEMAFGKEKGNDLLYENITWNVSEMYFDKGEEALFLSGDFSSGNTKLGYLAPVIKLGRETVLEIIEHEIKKLNKVKTFIEVTK